MKLIELNHSKLKVLGIDIVGHRLKFLKELDSLKQSFGIEIQETGDESQEERLSKKIISQGSIC
jgi:hypothetical protein